MQSRNYQQKEPRQEIDHSTGIEASLFQEEKYERASRDGPGSREICSVDTSESPSERQ